MRSMSLSLIGLIVVVILACTGCAAIKITPEDVRQAHSEYMLGMSFIEQGRLQDAFVKFQKAVQFNPQNKDAHNMLGHIYTVLEQYENSLASYDRAIEIDPSYSEAHNNRSVTLIRMERWKDAIESAERALENPLYPTPENALNNIGFARMKMGNYEGAIKAFRQALLRRALPEAGYNMALAFIELGQIRAAMSELEKLVERYPQYAHAHYQLARLYLRQGDREKAKIHFTQAATLAPDQEVGILADSELKRLK